MSGFHCSFCGKTEDEVEVVVPGPSVYVCDECLAVCLYAAEQKKPGIVSRILTSSSTVLDVTATARVEPKGQS